MISKNTVDLTGMVWNFVEKEYEGKTVIGFNLSVPNNYKDSNGDWKTDYDNIWCVYSKKKDNPKNEAKYNHLVSVLKDKVVIRVQGRLSSWIRQLDVEKVTQHNVQIKDYEVIREIDSEENHENPVSEETYGITNLPYSTKFNN